MVQERPGARDLMLRGRVRGGAVPEACAPQAVEPRLAFLRSWHVTGYVSRA